MSTDKVISTKSKAPNGAHSLDQLVRRLTPTERKTFEQMETGIWYDAFGDHARSLPWHIRRRQYVLSCLHEKGAIEKEVRQAVPGDWFSLYSVFRRPEPPNAGDQV